MTNLPSHTKLLCQSDRFFALLMVVGIFVVIAIWLFEEYFEVIQVYDRYGYAGSIFASLVCLALTLKFQKAHTAKLLLFLYITLYLVGLSVVSFLHSAQTGNIYTFASSLQWIPVIYLVAFLFLSPQQAVASTLSIYILLVTFLILPYLGWIKVEASLKALSLQVVVSHAVYIFCLFGVVKLRQTQEASQRRAIQMENAANNDGLLGIGNRRMLQTELNARMATKTPFFLLLIDVDFFKAINDMHGHLVGDDVLRAISTCMADNIRPQDTIGRWGGEEFLVIANGGTLDDAVKLAERLRLAVASMQIDPVGQVTVSIGVAPFEANTSISQTFSAADKRLYAAKNAGRNKVVAA